MRINKKTAPAAGWQGADNLPQIEADFDRIYSEDQKPLQMLLS